MTRTRLYAIFTVFVLSVTVLSLGPVCLLIECNLRQTVHGRVTFDAVLTVEEGLPALGESLPPRLGQALTALLTPGYRGAVTLWRLETQAAADLWERLLPG